MPTAIFLPFMPLGETLLIKFKPAQAGVNRRLAQAIGFAA
jgi:hypothetical protein